MHISRVYGFLSVSSTCTSGFFTTQSILALNFCAILITAVWNFITRRREGAGIRYLYLHYPPGLTRWALPPPPLPVPFNYHYPVRCAGNALVSSSIVAPSYGPPTNGHHYHL